MANLQSFGITANGAASITVQDWIITASVQDDENTVLADFTGTNALHYPSVLATLTLDQQHDLLSEIATRIVLLKAGLVE